ncbi:hypothetical protein [Staphylococcus hominis]|uniref:hypothetical protein n=1 Tax=Staphylococcus hominis TaxID=1290 RepID=UPI000D1D9E7A|nr:hypothetical protein [Staphylococcus hominis]PTK37696.1 hypothetical protein BUZ45_03075 [Staphylococcus hominis]
MKIEDINLEGKTPEEIVKMVNTMYQQANKLLIRAEEELGLEIAIVNAAIIKDENNEGIHTAQTLYDENDLMAHCMTDVNGELTKLGEVGEIYNHVQFIEAISKTFIDDEEEE